MPMENVVKPEFPWPFLSDPNGPYGDLAATWMFLQLQGKAYKGFLERGPGVLAGPYLTDENDASITSHEAIRRRPNNELVGNSVMYLPVMSADFRKFTRPEAAGSVVILNGLIGPGADFTEATSN